MAIAESLGFLESPVPG